MVWRSRLERAASLVANVSVDDKHSVRRRVDRRRRVQADALVGVKADGFKGGFRTTAVGHVHKLCGGQWANFRHFCMVI